VAALLIATIERTDPEAQPVDAPVGGQEEVDKVHRLASCLRESVVFCLRRERVGAEAVPALCALEDAHAIAAKDADMAINGTTSHQPVR